MVTEIEQLVKLKSHIADSILLHVNLQALPVLLEVRESGLTHQANSHDATGHAYGHARVLHLLGRLVGVLRQNLWDRVGEFVLGRIRGLAQRFNLLQLLAPEFVDFLVECQSAPFAGNRLQLARNIQREIRKRDYKAGHPQSLSAEQAAPLSTA